VIPAAFDYIAAQSVEETLTLLTQYGDDAKILAGGHSLIPLMRFRLSEPSTLIDINRISKLEYMQEVGNELVIGALTREAELDTSPLIRDRYALLYDTASGIADPIVRNWATVGGNLAHADPANDHPATMLALGAKIVVVGSSGKRVIPVDTFFTDQTFETALQPDELLTEIHIPMPTEHSGGAYYRLERKVGDYAIAGVAVYVTLDRNGLVKSAGIGLTNVGPYPIKARVAEQFLLGKPLDESNIQEAARLASTEAQPVSDGRGPAEYKRAMVKTLCVRALHKANERISGTQQ
jgi:aerobic carbon-monoxide dehydrogenase medium subunit